jgi:hypothetical protein
MQPVRRKVALGLAVLAGTVGLGAGLAVAQADGTTPPTTQAPAPPSDQAPDDRPRGRDGRDCAEKGDRGDGGGTEDNSTNAVMRLSRDAI